MTDTATLERPADAFAALRTVVAPDGAALNAGPAAMLRMAKTFTIESDDDYALAADELRQTKAKIDALSAKRVAITGPMNAALKAINDLFRGPMDALVEAANTYKASMLGYDAAKQKIAAEQRRVAEAAAAAERRKLEEEAAAVERAAAAEREAAAEVERKRVAAARAEQERIDAEARAAAAAGDAEATRKAEEAGRLAREREEIAAAESRRLAELAAQETAQAAESLRNVAAVIVAPVAETKVQVKGISTAKTFDFEVTDLLALVKHIAEHPDHINLLRADDVKLRGLVKSLGLNTKLPGVRVFEKSTLRAAAR